MGEYYVYEWFNTDTEEIFYVGKGKGDRMHARWGKARSKKWYEYYNTHNCDVRKIKSGLSEEEAYSLEKETIAKYRKNKEPLVNVDEGRKATGDTRREK